MPLKIIGNGMIAKAFLQNFKFNGDLVIYASGVSNSDCIDPIKFERERLLLCHELDKISNDYTFLYFGTCSIYDPDSFQKPYLVHKIKMEKIVLSHPSGIIIRLPQLAGLNAPPNTLLSALVSKIRAGELIEVWSNAVRNIIDVVDVVKIVDSLFIEGLERNSVTNVANPFSINVTNLIAIIEAALEINANIVLVPKGSRYDIDISSIYKATKKTNINFGKDYLLKTIIKYYIC
jgi:UDP-2-acetamido-2,6-beta-L-arabino-hexul-4-ose reductase